MIRTGCRWVSIALIAAMTAACSGPCDELADRTCARLGESDKLCLQLRAIAEQPQDGDSRACKAGHAFIHELQKAR